MSQRWKVKNRKETHKQVNPSPGQAYTGTGGKELCQAPSGGTERVSSKNKNSPAESQPRHAVLSGPTHSSHTEDNKEIRLSPP